MSFGSLSSGDSDWFEEIRNREWFWGYVIWWYIRSSCTHRFSLLHTVNFTECDLIFRITTLWVSDSVSPPSETDDIVQINYVCILASYIFPFISRLLPRKTYSPCFTFRSSLRRIIHGNNLQYLIWYWLLIMKGY